MSRKAKGSPYEMELSNTQRRSSAASKYAKVKLQAQATDIVVSLQGLRWREEPHMRPNLRDLTPEGKADLRGHTPVRRLGKYALYEATPDKPLPSGLRCLSSRYIDVAWNYPEGEIGYGIQLRGGLTSGYAKYLVDDFAVGENELGEVGL